jgi:uncharacterized membrane protein YoaK (UPF0700 family)
MNMSPRNRILLFGTAISLIVAGAISGAILTGITGEAVALSLASAGAVAFVALVFFEVGRSEDHDREKNPQG